MSGFLGQKKLTAQTLIILMVIIGVVWVIYNSKKDIKIPTEQTSKVAESSNTSLNSAEAIAADQSGKLADKLFKQETAPKFSLYPPAGWSKLQPEGNIVVEFGSPVEDKVEEGVAWLTVRPNITVFIAQEKYKNLDEAVEAANGKSKLNDLVSQKQKIKINGEDALIIESVRDISDSTRKTLESQVKEKISTTTGAVSQKETQKNIDEVLKKAKVKIISYSFYRDGYYINVTGKALESFWDKRGPQLKK